MIRRLLAWRPAVALLLGQLLLTHLAMRADEPPAENKPPQFTPEQQQQLDRANELLRQTRKLKDQGKYQEAIPLAAEALQLREAVLAADDTKIAIACSWLGVVHQYSGNYAEALPFFQRAIKIDEKAYGPESSEVAVDLSLL